MNSPRKILSLLALTAVAGSAALTGAASAATVDQPVVMGPSERIPIDFGGYKEPADKRLPKNFRIVKVHVALAHGERTSVKLQAPAGFRAVTIGISDGHQIGGVVDDVNYPGKRSVRVKLWTNSNLVHEGQTGQGTVYLLARRA